jgi:hypothetical protein
MLREDYLNQEGKTSNFIIANDLAKLVIKRQIKILIWDSSGPIDQFQVSSVYMVYQKTCKPMKYNVFRICMIQN